MRQRRRLSLAGPVRYGAVMIRVAAFYRFTPFADPAALAGPLRACATVAGVRGTILLAPEGLNGTVAGPPEGMDALLAHLRTLPGCADLDWRESTAPGMPFGRLKVRLKREIVTFRQPGTDLAAGAEPGSYVEPAAWNVLIGAPDVVTIDVRNDYEVRIGSFAGAVDPGTARFSDFADWWQANRARFTGRRIAAFCTGGIRCEKATAFLRAEGAEVFHLKGGILRYLAEVPPAESLWRGECFVFDERVAVGHGLEPGEAVLCRGCRRPLLPSDLSHPDHEPGVSCHHCAATLTPERRAALRERERQVRMAAARGAAHLGADAAAAQARG